MDIASLRELLQSWGYGIIFAAMLLESAGLPLPGETITLLGGRWIPLERMLRGLVEFGLGLLLLAVLIVLVPRWQAWWEQRQLDSNNGP